MVHFVNIKLYKLYRKKQRNSMTKKKKKKRQQKDRTARKKKVNKPIYVGWQNNIVLAWNCVNIYLLLAHKHWDFSKYQIICQMQQSLHSTKESSEKFCHIILKCVFCILRHIRNPLQVSLLYCFYTVNIKTNVPEDFSKSKGNVGLFSDKRADSSL